MDPEALNRIRASRAAEDAAVASLFRQVAVVQAARQRRTAALAALDADVRRAEDALAGERSALVDVAGLERAATILAVTPVALRKSLRTTPRSPAAADHSGSADGAAAAARTARLGEAPAGRP